MVTGYKYNNENAANGAAQSLRVHFGVPVDGGLTTEWVEVSYDEQGFYYFLGDYAPVLGQPEQFELTPIEL